MNPKGYEMALALLGPMQTGDGHPWKGQDRDAMDRLHAKEYLRPEDQGLLQRHSCRGV